MDVTDDGFALASLVLPIASDKAKCMNSNLADIGNLAASVTIRQIGVTGTATVAEVLAATI